MSGSSNYGIASHGDLWHPEKQLFTTINNLNALCLRTILKCIANVTYYLGLAFFQKNLPFYPAFTGNQNQHGLAVFIVHQRFYCILPEVPGGNGKILPCKSVLACKQLAIDWCQ